MRFTRALAVTAALLSVASPSSAQAPAPALPAGGPGIPDERQIDGQAGSAWLRPDGIDLAPRAAEPGPFKALGGDFKALFSGNTARFLGLASVLAVAATPWDREGVREAQEHWAQAQGTFKAGNIGGNFLVQTGAALATYGIGKAAGSTKAAAVGGDLFRAQVLSQVSVQGLKLATRRPRPDASNNHSFPSGHTSSAFATATVLERHFGWKAGVPAYAFAAYVGAARMSANKHHLSDVFMGAALGIAAGRVVTVGIGGTSFGMGVAPTPGGAAVVLTKK